ncbi:MAG TPA: amidohydrolase family protein [Dongiaceae bacterium]
MDRVDSHQHFWRLERGDYSFPTPVLKPIYRDYGPADLTPILDKWKIGKTVMVQVTETVEETRFLLELAATSDRFAGVVGWVDFTGAEATVKIDDLAQNPKLKGFRPMIQSIPADDWILRPDITTAVQQMTRRKLSLDALTMPRHLPHLKILLERHPELSVVIDHGSKPEIRSDQFQPWAEEMREIARESRACCKLSGLVTEARSDWSVDTLRRYVDHIIACFGADRVMWGSDWPVVNLAGGYDAWAEATDKLLSGLNAKERDAILGGTATQFYRL